MEETTNESSSLIKETIREGITLAIIHVLIFIILYYILPSKLTGFSYLAFVILVNLGFCIFKGLNYRKEVGGFIGFSAAFKYSFLILFFNGLISSLLIPIAFSAIDSEYGHVMAQSQIDTSVYWAEKFGAPEESLDQMREKMDVDELAKSYTPVKALFGFGVANLFYALGAAIAAFSFRKNEPEII